MIVSSQSEAVYLNRLLVAFSVIGGCLLAAVMFGTLCCAFFWYKKFLHQKKRRNHVDQVPRAQFLPVIRGGDVIEFVLPAHNPKVDEKYLNNNLPVTRSSSQLSLSDLNVNLYNRGLVTNEEINEEKAKIGISVQYNSQTQELYVKVLGALNLAHRHKGTLPDPYVKVTLLPEKQAKFTTRTLRSTGNPLFNEVFVFKITTAQLNECALKLSVRDRHDLSRLVNSDNAGGQIASLASICNTLGHAVIPLSDFDLNGSNDGRRQVMWCLLQQKTLKLTNSEKGDISVSLRYEPEIGKLFIEVTEARNLPPPNQEREKLIVKLLLYERKYLIAARRSKGIRRKENLSLNVAFNFLLIPRTLHEASCQILIISRSKIGTKRTLGRLTLGHRYFFSTTNTWISSSGLDHWHDMEHRPGISIQRWHQLQ